MTKPHQEDRGEPFFITEQVEADLIAAGYVFEPPQPKQVREGREGSWEDGLHEIGPERFHLRLRDDAALWSLTSGRRIQRAIGVIYRPETERQSHYFYTRLAHQFDTMIHIDETHALEPLDRGPVWTSGIERPRPIRQAYEAWKGRCLPSRSRAS